MLSLPLLTLCIWLTSIEEPNLGDFFGFSEIEVIKIGEHPGPVYTGDVNGDGLIDWPAYSEADDRYLEIGDEFSVSGGWRSPQMVFLHKYLGAGR